MSYTHDRDITLEGWIVHTSQANAKGTIKEHRNPILESRCKSKRGMESELVPTEPIQTYPIASVRGLPTIEKRPTKLVGLHLFNILNQN